MKKTSFYKILFLVVFIMLFLKNNYSQVTYSNKVSSLFCFTAGLTSSSLYRDTINYEQGIHFAGGFAYTFAVADKANIGIELLYTGKLVKKSSPIIKYRFYYLDIPVYFQYKFNDYIRANVGLQYSKYMNSKFDYL